MRRAGGGAGAAPGVNHGATLKIDIGSGRFVFFYLPVEPGL